MNQPKDEFPKCSKCGAELPAAIPGEPLRCVHCGTIASGNATGERRSPAPSGSPGIDAFAPVDAIPVGDTGETPSTSEESLSESAIDAVPVDAVPVDAVPVDAIPLDAIPVNPSEADEKAPPSQPPQPPTIREAASDSYASSNPYAAPIHGSRGKYTVGASIGFTIAVCVGMLGAMAIAPFTIVPMLVVGPIALLRSQAAIRRATTMDEFATITFGDQIVAFAKSLAVTIAIAIASFFAFFVTCATVLPFSAGRNTPNSFEVAAIALVFIVPVVSFFGLIYKTWPKRFSR